jgi:hypothetical protein
MSASLPALIVGLSVLLFACGSPSGDQPRHVAGRGATPAAPAATAEGGTAEIPAPTEDELRRMLDALEQEIDDH